MVKKKTTRRMKNKVIPKPKENLVDLHKTRDGGQIALRGYSYQFLYSCYLMVSAANENTVFQLEGIEDIDKVIQDENGESIIHIQLKHSVNKQDASFMSSVLKNFLEAYLLDKNREFKLVYDFPVATGNFSELVQGKLSLKSREYWKKTIDTIKKSTNLWNWEVYDFDEFLSKLSFENIKKESLEDSVECALIQKFNVTTDNIKLFANGIKLLCLDRMERREIVTQSVLQRCIEEIRIDISKGPHNPAHSWVKRVEFITCTNAISNYYEGKKATPSDIANDLPVSRPLLEKELIDSVHENMITILKASSGQGKTTLALKTLFALQKEYTPYQITCCNDIHEIGHIVDYFRARTRLGEKPLILLDNLDAHLCEWNQLAQLMQSDVTYNYKLIVTSRENDWYNYGGDTSNIHSLNIIKPLLSEDEALGIFQALQAVGYLHSDITDWRKPWLKIADRKLLIEYVYLLTHGEMISERISAQMKEMATVATAGLKFEILRKVCFADVCGTKLSTRKLINELAQNVGYDIGELLKSMVDEFLVQVSQEGDFIEGLHPVRSKHIVERLHEYYPLDETAFAVTKIADVQDFPILFSHYPEFDFDKEKLYSNIVDTFWNPENLKCFVYAIRGVFSGSVMQYFRNNKKAFDDANEHGGLFVLATSLCPFAEFKEFDESMDALERMAEICPDNRNVRYLIRLRDSIPEIDIAKTDVYILNFILFKKMKNVLTTDIVDIESYALIVDWLYNVNSTMNLAANIELDNLLTRLDEYAIDSIVSLMYTSYCGNREVYYDFVRVNIQSILLYLKHKTFSHNLYVCDEGKGVHVEYILSASEMKAGNEESVLRLKYICRALPIFEKYYADAIKPQLNMLETYMIPDDAHKEMPYRNLAIMFRQEFTSLWIKTIQSNYEFDSVVEWLEHWFSARECVCEIFEKICMYMYKILEGKRIGSTGEEIDKKIAQYDKYVLEINSYPKEHRPFEKTPDLPQKFVKIKQNYFCSVQYFLRQFVGLLKKNADGIRLALINLKQARAYLALMQDFFNQMSLDVEFRKKQETLCEWEEQKINEAYMCCHYYVKHHPNADFNKYQIKSWYISMYKAEINEVNEALFQIKDLFKAQLPTKIYEDGIFCCYPIVLKKFDFTNEEMLQEFMISVASIPQFPYDYLILMVCNDGGNVLPMAVRFSKRLFETLHEILVSGEDRDIDSLSTPYPIDVKMEMLDCFSSDVKMQLQDSVNQNNRCIGDIAEELWMYSKNCELLCDEGDNSYRTNILEKVQARIDTILQDIKTHFSTEIYDEMVALCSSVYGGKVFDNDQINNFIQCWQKKLSQ